MELFLFRYLWVIFFICEYEISASLSSISRCFRGESNKSEKNTSNIASSIITDAWWYDSDSMVHGTHAFLKDNTKPVQYWLDITQNLNEKTYKGDLMIKVEILKPTKTITLNSEQLDIEDVTVTEWDVTVAEIKTKFTFNVQTNQIIIDIQSKKLRVDTFYKVRIIFSGYLYQRNPFGLVVYTVENPEQRSFAYMIETHFDPFYARKTFPCYDEPKFRSQFTLTLTLNNNERAISNIELNNEEENAETNTKVVRFDSHINDISPNMLYFAILGEGYQEKNLQNKYFVWTVAKYIDQVEYAVKDLKMAAEITNSLFSQENYSLGRIDLVTPIRNRYSHWTLSYTRKHFLCVEHLCPVSHQEMVTRNVIRHVMLKWLNEYVSIESWNQLWLRDGLSTYYENKLLDKMKSEWRMSDILSSIIRQNTLFNEYRLYYNPLFNGNDPTKTRIFKLIYKQNIFEFYNNKASLIISMLTNWLGEDKFDEIMKAFLKNGRENGYIASDQLWQEIEQILSVELPYGKSLSHVMQLYTTQSGYPLLSVRLTKNRHPQIAIKQEPYFYFEMSGKRGTVANLKWIVPITITTETKMNFDDTMPIAWSTANKEIYLEQSLTQKDEWYILNLKNAGYQRVNYDKGNWKLLIRQLQNDPKKIHHLNRVQLIADSHVLAADGILSLAIPIRMFTYIKDEQDPLVWLAAFDSFERLYFALGSESRPLYQDFFTTCLKYKTERVGLKISSTDDHVTKLLKRKMMKFLCSIGDEHCVDIARQIYYDNEDDLTRIDPNIKSTVFCTMLRGEDSQSVEITLDKLISDSNNTCIFDAVKNAFSCRHLSFDLPTKIKDLVENTINGDANAMSDLMDALDMVFWNLDVIVLEKIRDTISEWVNKKQEQGIDASTNEIQNLASLVEYFKKNIMGIAEADIIVQMRELIEKKWLKDRHYAPLVTALWNVQDSVWFKFGAIQHPLAFAVLSSYSCDPTTLKPFRLEIMIENKPVQHLFDPTPGAAYRDEIFLYDFLDNPNYYFKT